MLRVVSTIPWSTHHHSFDQSLLTGCHPYPFYHTNNYHKDPPRSCQVHRFRPWFPPFGCLSQVSTSSMGHCTVVGKSRYRHHLTFGPLLLRSSALLPPSDFGSNDDRLYSKNAQCRLHTDSQCSSSNKLIALQPTLPTQTIHIPITPESTLALLPIFYMVYGTHDHIYLVESFACQVGDQMCFVYGSRTG